MLFNLPLFAHNQHWRWIFNQFDITLSLKSLCRLSNGLFSRDFLIHSLAHNIHVLKTALITQLNHRKGGVIRTEQIFNCFTIVVIEQRAQELHQRTTNNAIFIHSKHFISSEVFHEAEATLSELFPFASASSSFRTSSEEEKRDEQR